MKRQTQAIGVRDWYGWDFLSLQEEPLKVIDSFFSQYGAFVVSGCDVSANGSKYNIAPGLVALSGTGAEGSTVKIVVPFAGITSTALPVYLTLGYDTENDVYHDGKVKPIINIYKAVATTVRPAGSCVQITQAAVLRFVDVIQDVTHRFITDTERTAWNKAVQDVAKYTPFDYVVDSNAALAGLNNNPNATCVLIKKGTWSISTSIMLHPNTKRIVGEPGNVIRSAGGSTASFYYATKPNMAAGYSIQGVNVVLTASGVTGFYQMVNLSDCTCECAKLSDQNESSCFHTCGNLDRCTAIIHENYHPGEGYWSCENLRQCRAQSDMASSYAIGIRQCKVVVECYSDCHIDDSYNVFMCQTNFFSGSYFSSSANTTYKCADTLNGGWNKTITV